MAKDRPRRLARQIARQLDIKDGDVVGLLKKESNVTTEDIRLFNALRNAFGATGKENVVLVVLDSWEDLRVFKEEDMKEYGWCRCEERSKD